MNVSLVTFKPDGERIEPSSVHPVTAAPLVHLAWNAFRLSMLQQKLAACSASSTSRRASPPPASRFTHVLQARLPFRVARRPAQRHQVRSPRSRRASSACSFMIRATWPLSSAIFWRTRGWLARLSTCRTEALRVALAVALDAAVALRPAELLQHERHERILRRIRNLDRLPLRRPVVELHVHVFAVPVAWLSASSSTSAGSRR